MIFDQSKKIQLNTFERVRQAITELNCNLTLYQNLMKFFATPAAGTVTTLTLKIIKDDGQATYTTTMERFEL